MEEQPTTERRSFERETEFSLEMIRMTQAEIRENMRSIRHDVAGLKGGVWFFFVLNALFLAVLVFSRC